MMKQVFCYEYPRPALSADCVVFGFDGKELSILLIKRKYPPYKGKWALPGGFMEMDENAEECARRELIEETGLQDVFIEQLYTFSSINRDPRGRVVTVAYYALVRQSSYQLQAGDDAMNAQWFRLSEIPELAFDHIEILSLAKRQLKSRVKSQPFGYDLLDENFSLPELQRLYEVILGFKLDRRNFRKKMLQYNLLVALDEKKANVPFKAPRLYKFDKKQYGKLSEEGYEFKI